MSEAGTPSHLYFIGIWAATQQTTLCERGNRGHANRPQPGTVIQILLDGNGPAGQTIDSLLPANQYYVGSADYPIDSSEDFMNYHHNFVELGRLDAILLPFTITSHLRCLSPSDARTALLSHLQLNDDVKVYVLYFYHEV